MVETYQEEIKTVISPLRARKVWPLNQVFSEKAKLLKRAFFNRDPRTVSRQLLGKLIVRKEGSNILAGRIVEVEAYLGADDA